MLNKVSLIYAVVLSLTSWPLFYWLAPELSGGYCAISGFLIGYIFGNWINNRSTKSAVIVFSGMLAVVASILSGVLYSILTSISQQEIIVFQDFTKTIVVYAAWPFMLFGLPVIVYSLLNLAIWSKIGHKKANKLSKRDALDGAPS